MANGFYNEQYRNTVNNITHALSQNYRADGSIDVEGLGRAISGIEHVNNELRMAVEELARVTNDRLATRRNDGTLTEQIARQIFGNFSLELRRAVATIPEEFGRANNVSPRGGVRHFGAEVTERLVEGYNNANRDLSAISQHLVETNSRLNMISHSVQQLESSVNNSVSLLVSIADGLHTTQVQQQVELSNLNNNLGQSNLLLQNIQSAQSQVQANLQAVQQQMLSNQQAMTQHFSTLVNTIQQNGIKSTQQQQEESNKEKQSQKSFLNMLVPQIGKLLKHSPILDLLKWGFLLLGDKLPVVGAMGILGAPLLAGGITKGITNLMRGKGFFGGAFKGINASQLFGWSNARFKSDMAFKSADRIAHANRVLNNPNATASAKAHATKLKAMAMGDLRLLNMNPLRPLQNLGTNISKFLSPVFTTINNWATGLLGTISTRLSPVIKGFQSAGGYVSNVLKSAGGHISTAFGNLLGKVTPLINIIKNSSLGSAIGKLGSGAGLIGSRLTTGRGIGLLTRGTSSLGMVSKAMRGSGILSAGLSVLGDIPKLIQAKKDGKFAGQLTQTAGGAVGAGLGTVIGGAIGSFLGPIGTILGSALGSWIGQHLGKWFGGGLGPHVQKLADSFGRLGSVLAPIFSALGERLLPLLQSFGNAISSIAETLITGLGNALGTLADGVTWCVNKIADGVDWLAKKFGLGSAKDADGKGDKEKTASTPVQAPPNTVDMRKMGLHGGISKGNSKPFIAQQNAGRLRELDDLLKSWGVDFEYTSAMGGKHAGGARSHGAGAKVDLVLKKGGRLTKQQEQELVRRGFYGGATGAVGYHDAGSGYHYDLSVLDKNKAGSTRIASAGSVVTEGNTANVATTSSEVYSKVMDRTGGADTKDKQATVRNLVFSATDVTGSLGVWGITHNNNTGRTKGA
jgi:hypothetical protein